MRLETEKEEAERQRFQHIWEQAENGREVHDEIKESWLMIPRTLQRRPCCSEFRQDCRGFFVFFGFLGVGIWD